jgi:hypothetical protein
LRLQLESGEAGLCLLVRNWLSLGVEKGLKGVLVTSM